MVDNIPQDELNKRSSASSSCLCGRTCQRATFSSSRKCRRPSVPPIISHNLLKKYHYYILGSRYTLEFQSCFLWHKSWGPNSDLPALNSLWKLHLSSSAIRLWDSNAYILFILALLYGQGICWTCLKSGHLVSWVSNLIFLQPWKFFLSFFFKANPTYTHC